ncbi:MAG: LysM domain-containing protein, partial [Rectinemataceae bacterium]|nr:LysM domain-containing protein [Rectinemataceae bacterium]
MKPNLLPASILIMIIMFIATSNLSAAEPVYHTLKKGETLFSLSRVYDIPYEALAAANGITDPTRLKVGDRLVVPELYKVENGDSLSVIARAYGITIDAVRKANMMGSQSVIQPG